MSHCSGSGPLSAQPTDSLPLSGDSLLRELLYKRANFWRHCCKCRALHWLGRRPFWNSAHRDKMSLLRWHESLLSALAVSFLFKEQPRSSFLPGRRQAPRQRTSPFFPEVHNEINKSWRAAYSSCLCASSSSALTYGWTWRRWRMRIRSPSSTPRSPAPACLVLQ